jgi:hypothetical protein
MEKMLMNISKEDFLLLTGLAEFHFKFSEYVKEQDKEMFYRAIDYAKTFTESEGMKFDYWHENNKRFLEELCEIIIKKQNSYNKFTQTFDDDDEAEVQWMKKKKTSKEDPLGMKSYLENFVRHSRELDYDSFDTNDWENFIKICKCITDDPKFIEFATNQVKRVLGETSDFLKEF